MNIIQVISPIRIITLKNNFCIQNYKLEQSLYVFVRQTLQIHMQLI